ncbi:MAG: NUDIX hydrolase [bacterium]|nr:NUDIX hydrolase [bacterium]
MRRKAVGVYVVNDEGRLLLSQRGPSARHEPFKWESVGGEVEKGENFEQAAQREAREELGIHIEQINILSVHQKLFDSTVEEWEVKKFLARTNDKPFLNEPDVSIGFGWFTIDETAKLELASYAVGDLEILRISLSMSK